MAPELRPQARTLIGNLGRATILPAFLTLGISGFFGFEATSLGIGMIVSGVLGAAAFIGHRSIERESRQKAEVGESRPKQSPSIESPKTSARKYPEPLNTWMETVDGDMDSMVRVHLQQVDIKRTQGPGHQYSKVGFDAVNRRFYFTREDGRKIEVPVETATREIIQAIMNLSPYELKVFRLPNGRNLVNWVKPDGSLGASADFTFAQIYWKGFFSQVHAGKLQIAIDLRTVDLLEGILGPVAAAIASRSISHDALLAIEKPLQKLKTLREEASYRDLSAEEASDDVAITLQSELLSHAEVLGLPFDPQLRTIPLPPHQRAELLARVIAEIEGLLGRLELEL